MGFRHRVLRAVTAIANMLVEDEGTLVVDTTTKKLYYHDGIQIGGHSLSGVSTAEALLLAQRANSLADGGTSANIDWNTLTTQGLHPVALTASSANHPDAGGVTSYTCFNNLRIEGNNKYIRQEAIPVLNLTNLPRYWRHGSSINNAAWTWSSWTREVGQLVITKNSSASTLIDNRMHDNLGAHVINMVGNITALSVRDSPPKWTGTIPIIIVQDATGGRKITSYNAALNVVAGNVPYIDPRPGAVTLLQLLCLKDVGHYLIGPTEPPGHFVQSLTATQANSTVTPANISELVVAMEANCIYEVDCWVMFTSAATTTGLGLGFTAPTDALCFLESDVPLGTNITSRRMIHPWAAASGNTGMNIGTAVAVAGSVYTARLHGIVRMGATAGNFAPQFQSEVAASAVTLQIGSTIKVKRLT